MRHTFLMSVRKRRWKTSKGETREAWIVDYVDSNGNRHIQSFQRKREADEYRDRISGDVRSGKHVPIPKNETVTDLCGRWIKRAEAEGRERATLAQYSQHVKLHIVPRIGTLKAAKLTTGHLEAFRDGLLASLSRPMARKVLTSLHSVLKGARQAHLMEGITIGRDKRNERRIESGRDFPTPTEIKRLIDAASDPKKRTLLLVVALTGLRSSELRGLRWSDIDLKAGELRVHQRADRYGKIGAPKSVSSVRNIPLERDMLIPALRQWKIACPAGDLVFPTSTGRIDHHSNILRSLAPVMIAAGVVDKEGRPKYALHAFRHFFASWCLNPRERGGREKPIKLVQYWLGHGSIVMTMDVYGHMLPSSDDHTELAASARALLG